MPREGPAIAGPSLYGRRSAMGHLLDAAKKWDSLQHTSYRIIIGKQHKAEMVHIQFRPIDFSHLSGIHYARDVDLGPRWAYQGSRLIPALLSGKLDDSKVEKSQEWHRINDRLCAILKIETILDSNFSIYKFAPQKLNFYSTIDASYLIYSETYQEGVCLFLDNEENICYCKSVFSADAKDYRQNQTRWVVLEKIKIVGPSENMLYTHPSYSK